MVKFRAEAVFAGEIPNADCDAVILSEHSDGRSGRRLEIQRAWSFSAQDKRLGQDKYAICTEDGTTHYGGIVAWRLLGNRLELSLDSDAADVFSVDMFSVEMIADSSRLRAVQDMLCKILDLGKN